MERYYYNIITKEYCGTNIPIGDGFSYTNNNPEKYFKNIKENNSLFYINGNWIIKTIEDKEDKYLDNIYKINELETKLDDLNKKITILERIKNKTEKENLDLELLIYKSTDVYRQIEKIKLEISNEQ